MECLDAKAHVAGAVLLDKRFGVPDVDIADILHTSGLRWDEVLNAVTPNAQCGRDGRTGRRSITRANSAPRSDA